MIFIQLYMQQTKSFYGKIEFFTENIKSILNIDLQIQRIVACVQTSPISFVARVQQRK